MTHRSVLLAIVAAIACSIPGRAQQPARIDTAVVDSIIRHHVAAKQITGVSVGIMQAMLPRAATPDIISCRRAPDCAAVMRAPEAVLVVARSGHYCRLGLSLVSSSDSARSGWSCGRLCRALCFLR